MGGPLILIIIRNKNHIYIHSIILSDVHSTYIAKCLYFFLTNLMEIYADPKFKIYLLNFLIKTNILAKYSTELITLYHYMNYRCMGFINPFYIGCSGI